MRDYAEYIRDKMWTTGLAFAYGTRTSEQCVLYDCMTHVMRQPDWSVVELADLLHKCANRLPTEFQSLCADAEYTNDPIRIARRYPICSSNVFVLVDALHDYEPSNKRYEQCINDAQSITKALCPRNCCTSAVSMYTTKLYNLTRVHSSYSISKWKVATGNTCAAYNLVTNLV